MKAWEAVNNYSTTYLSIHQGSCLLKSWWYLGPSAKRVELTLVS